MYSVHASEASLDEQLFNAVLTGNTGEVRELLQRGADVDTIGEIHGMTVLVAAIHANHKEIAEMLIEAGADIDASGGFGYTPLLMAIKDGKQELATLLLRRNADANAGFTSMGETALLLASKLGFYDIARMLLAQGADRARINEPGGRNNMTALMYAAQKGRKKIAQLLLDNSAEVNVVDDQGWTALMHAAQQLERRGRDSDELRSTFLEIVNALLASGADPNVIGRDNATALTALVCSAKNPLVWKEEVMLLLEAGANPDLGMNPYGGARNTDNTLWFCLVRDYAMGMSDMPLVKTLINASRKSGKTIFIELAQEVLRNKDVLRNEDAERRSGFKYNWLVSNLKRILQGRIIVPPTEEEMTQVGLSSEEKDFIRSLMPSYLESIKKEAIPDAKELARTRLPDDIITSVLVQKYGPFVEHEDVLPHIEEALRRPYIERLLKGQVKKIMHRQEEKKREEEKRQQEKSAFQFQYFGEDFEELE